MRRIKRRRLFAGLLIISVEALGLAGSAALAVHDVPGDCDFPGVENCFFEFDHGVGLGGLDEGANAIDETTILSPGLGTPPDDWAQNNFDEANPGTPLGYCEPGDNSCGYVSGPTVDPDAPRGRGIQEFVHI